MLFVLLSTSTTSTIVCKDAFPQVDSLFKTKFYSSFAADAIIDSMLPRPRMGGFVGGNVTGNQ